MLLNIAYIIIGCAIAFFLLIVFSSEPYPKELEEKENEELKKKFDEYKEKNQE